MKPLTSCLLLYFLSGTGGQQWNSQYSIPSISTGIYSYPLDQASEIAVRTAKQFVFDHPGELDVIMWVLFDDTTFKAYESQIEHWEVSEIVQSPDFYSINKMLRDGGI